MMQINHFSKQKFMLFQNKFSQSRYEVRLILPSFFTWQSRFEDCCRRCVENREDMGYTIVQLFRGMFETTSREKINVRITISWSTVLLDGRSSRLCNIWLPWKQHIQCCGLIHFEIRCKVERSEDQQFVLAEREDHLLLVKNCCWSWKYHQNLVLQEGDFWVWRIFRTTRTTFLCETRKRPPLIWRYWQYCRSMGSLWNLVIITKSYPSCSRSSIKRHSIAECVLMRDLFVQKVVNVKYYDSVY